MGFPLERLLADVRQLQLRAGAGHRDQRRSTRRRTCCARNPFLRDSLLHRPGRRADHQQGRAVASSTTPSTSRSSRPAASASRPRSISPASAATRTSTSRWSRASGSCRQAPRLTLGMRGQVEYIHAFSGSKELPIFEKLFLGGEYSVRGFDIRTIGPQDPVDRPGARRQQEPAVQRRGTDHDCRPGAADRVLRCRPGAGRADADWCPRSSCPSADRSISVVVPGTNFNLTGLQDVDRARGAVLHAGAQRTVPPDLRATIRSATACSTTTTSSRRRASSSALRWGRPSRTGCRPSEPRSAIPPRSGVKSRASDSRKDSEQ